MTIPPMHSFIQFNGALLAQPRCANISRVANLGFFRTNPVDGLFYSSEEFFVWPHGFLLQDHFDFQPIDFGWDKKPRGP